MTSLVIANTDGPLDQLAVQSFEERFGATAFNPICVVVPAFDEEGTVGGVLDAIPHQVCGIATSTLVMIDGSTDRTEEIAVSHGAFVGTFEHNRGQGIALRVGYRIALEHKARYVVIVDADGQWDPTEMERLIEPLVANEADMVQGSRRLGSATNGDKFRALGVVVFAHVISFLTRAHITDSSTGFRAFKAEVLSQLSFSQIQYQAAEVLIEILSLGFRVAERPVTHRERSAGISKKGHNLLYGVHYASVIVGTWWRVRRRFAHG